MANELTQYTVPDVEKMANAIAKSNLFGIKTPEQAFALMLIAQAEGRHPVEAARDYNIIQGRPAKTAEAMLRDFLSQGGKVEWHTLSDIKADATFSHPAGGSLRIDWDIARAKTAGLGGKDMWIKYPRQMLRSRVISEGVRSVCPAATSGMYVPEEVRDFDDKPMKDVTPIKESVIKPEAPIAPVNPETGEISPHTLILTEPADWKAFGVNMAVALKSSSTLDELSAWQTLNLEAITKMQDAAPKLHARLVTLGKEKYESFQTKEAA